MKFTKGFPLALLVSALIPATAQAHHVEGTADCNEVTADFIQFSEYETPANYVVKIDGVLTNDGATPTFEGSYHLVVPIEVPPGKHTIKFYAYWPQENSGKFTVYVDCPEPPVTPPTPPVTPPEEPPVQPPVPPEVPPVTPPGPQVICPPSGNAKAKIVKNGNSYRLMGRFLSEFRWFVDGKRIGSRRTVRVRFTKGGHSLVAKAKFSGCRKVRRDVRLPQAPPPPPKFLG